MGNNTNPSAFPYRRIKDYTDRVGTYEDSSTGMTLRDYFAGQALAGMCSNSGANTITFKADAAYKIADLMLKEREK